MIQLHDELLGELHRIIPFSNYNSVAAAEMASRLKQSHARWISDEGLPARRQYHDFSHTGWSKRRSLDIKTTMEGEPRILPCNTAIVMDVAKLFASKVRGLRSYNH